MSTYQVTSETGTTATIVTAKPVVFNVLGALRGLPGVSPTVGVGVVATGAAGSSVVVTNTGTSAAAVFNFLIPQGIKGDTGTIVKRIVTLTPGATVATNADVVDLALLTPAQNFTLSNPTGTLTDGQMIVWRITQDGTGSRILTLGAKFSLGAGLNSVILSTTPGKADYLGAQYSLPADKWHIIALQLGY